MIRRSLLATALLAALPLAGCQPADEPARDEVAQGPLDAASTEYASSDRVVPTSTVTLDYTGTLADGSEFDSGSNVTFPLGNVVPGFRDGLVGMAPGETKTFDVAPEDGYGSNPPPGIPPGAVLTFEVTVREVR